MNLNDSIKTIKGVGEKRAYALEKLNINTINDLAYFFPRKYEDRRKAVKIAEAAYSEDVLLECRVVTKQMSGSPYSKKSVLRVLVEDDTGMLEVIFFNAKYLSSYFEPGKKLALFGKISWNNGRRQMSHPEFHDLGSKEDVRGLFPIYPLTSGLGQNQIRALISQIKECFNLIPEDLPLEIVNKYKLASVSYALNNIHFPVEERAIREARYRLVFEELLTLETGLLYMKQGNHQTDKSVKLDNNVDIKPFIDSLKFKLTLGQERAVNDIINDLTSDKQMNRLVQGDVGSGKTAVAEISMYAIAKCGFQAAFMAPTELLAKQHFANIKRDFEPFKTNVELIYGGMKAKERKELLERLNNGEIDILVGTHALIQDDVEFKNLGLVITDEQHRFGVNQRTKLSSKGENPNILVMTATPIPRTIAVILYGDLDISIIDTLPLGRKPIKTYQRGSDARNKIYDFVSEKVKEGRQAYVVCPLIEESDSMDLRSSEEIYEELSNKYINLRIGLIHGQMTQAEKDEIMLNFKNHTIDILVSTVVIEVGIDVPNASIMVIENSERFGLAQLHQLRGRVGRGTEQSYCILITENESENSKERNEIMCRTNDGFVIAEEDLKMRGPGELFGTRQSGLPELHISDLIKNISVMEDARDCALNILNEDPNLSSTKYKSLRLKVEKLFGQNIKLNL